jgi:hypothetical protein
LVADAAGRQGVGQPQAAAASGTVTDATGAKSPAALSRSDAEFHDALFQDAEFHDALFHEALFQEALFHDADPHDDEFHDALFQEAEPFVFEFHEAEFHDAPDCAALFHDAASKVYEAFLPLLALTNWSRPAFGFGAKSGPIALYAESSPTPPDQFVTSGSCCAASISAPFTWSGV